jgi:Tol biopolymer transport system component
MRIPIIPILVVVVLLSGAVFLFTNMTSSRPILDAPKLDRIADIEGTETEVAVSGDGTQYAIVSSGDIWLLDTRNNSRHQITHSPEAESFPSWVPDGKQLTFTRGSDTWAVHIDAPDTAQLLRANATSLAFSPTGRIAFVRDRALWIADPSGLNERRIVEADANPDIIIRTPRFSPDSFQIAFIKSMLGLRGEVWSIDVAHGGTATALIADRQFENPLDVGWIMEGKHLVYLTNRSGAYALWHLDLGENSLQPLTGPIIGTPLENIGIAVWKDRIIVPRHFIDSNIALSDGTKVVGTGNVEFEPAISPDQRLVAYTVQKENKSEIWTVGLDGTNPTYRTLGREPRFAANGYQIVYTQTGLKGNEDIWTLDLRTNKSSVVTDADEIDVQPDWSPDGRNIVFASARGGRLSIWTAPASGGQRLRLNDAGAFPRYSPDGKSIVFWNENAVWMMDAAGGHLQKIRGESPVPVLTLSTPRGPRNYHDVEDSIKRPVWPAFDVLKDGRFLVAPIEIQETALWSVELQYKK